MVAMLGGSLPGLAECLNQPGRLAGEVASGVMRELVQAVREWRQAQTERVEEWLECRIRVRSERQGDCHAADRWQVPRGCASWLGLDAEGAKGSVTTAETVKRLKGVRPKRALPHDDSDHRSQRTAID